MTGLVPEKNGEFENDGVLGQGFDLCIDGWQGGVDGVAGAGQTGFEKKQADDECVKKRFFGQAGSDNGRGGDQSENDKTAGGAQPLKAGKEIVKEGVG